MAITPAFNVCHVRRSGVTCWAPGETWLVLHPSNDAILAYCSTEDEAWVAAAVINHAMERLRTEPLAQLTKWSKGR